MVIRRQLRCKKICPAYGPDWAGCLRAKRLGLGRVELIVLILLGLCIFVCLPQFLLDKRNAVRKQESTYHFRKVGLAVSQYHETYRAFPPAKKSTKPSEVK